MRSTVQFGHKESGMSGTDYCKKKFKKPLFFI